MIPTFVIATSLLAFPDFSRGYLLRDDYTQNNYAEFFSKFGFWTASDPTNGLVNYVSESAAWANGLIGNGGNIYLGVDHTNKPDVCGTWPAFWTTASSNDWPQEGEIDIKEEANNAQNNQMSLHISKTQGECVIRSDTSMIAARGRWGDCTEEDTRGCDANDPRTNSFGTGFNYNGGGVYAMEWKAEWVRIWVFPRSEIPSGASGPLGSSPDPSAWGTPTTSFESQHGADCNLSTHVRNQRIIIDTTFCGQWASGTWLISGCAASTGYSTCEAYVKDVPTAFRHAFWTINSVKTYD
ncbi:hypothetical protein BO71DRAFT_438425 [Aspergillus ellipticus CBS 707.79]|uniref:GH16 domain-containing protein n=1 Tax=Aspergillus ellipticus CBS 707.79 TaxID=1448320 RepID=A0A319DKT3_9EURO|nr:hypothetical protein BO71DRAFT_438425 [Aspergillus ellipticus CBS 707.79]